MVLEQALKATETYTYDLRSAPITGQASAQVKIIGDSVYQIQVKGYGSPYEEMYPYALGYLAPSLQHFKFGKSLSGVQVFPSSGVIFISDAYGPLARPADVLETFEKPLLSRLFRWFSPAAVATVATRESTVEKFQRLAKQWRDERDQKTSVSDMVMHPAYQQIIGMGREAIPFILGELSRETEPDHWFWALKAITSEDPVPAESQGKIFEMASAWLRWGREKGYRW